jgi:Uma2 family endonuclease
MTVADTPIIATDLGSDASQRFVFSDVDWAFYETVGEKLANCRVFITYYQGKLEIVTVSLLHETISQLLVIIIRIMAEETSTPIKGAGMTTLKRMDLGYGVEPDSSFYTIHELQMRGKTQLDLAIDPPPDLAIEVEVTHRLGARKNIYRDLGVPEVWVYSSTGLSILVKRDGGYVAVDRSPTFAILAPQEITQLITTGVRQDETNFTKICRHRVQEIIRQS